MTRRSCGGTRVARAGGQQGPQLDHAVRDELRQPPYSPHLLRYHAEFNGVIEGALAESWPADCETTPRGSLAKFLLMPLLPDGNLQAWLRLHPVAEPAELLDMLRQLLEAVAALVAAGLLHRDIKADNILVRAGGGGGGQPAVQLLLADFGTLSTMAVQQHGCTAGNPMKTAPELRGLEGLGPAAAAAVDLSKAEVWAVSDELTADIPVALSCCVLASPSPGLGTDRRWISRRRCQRMHDSLCGGCSAGRGRGLRPGRDGPATAVRPGRPDRATGGAPGR